MADRARGDVGRPPLPLWQQLREDWEANGGRLTTLGKPGLHAVAVHRFGQRLDGLPTPVRQLLLVVYQFLYGVVRNLYGIELPRQAQVGRRLRIGHQGGIVVNPAVRIGDDCLLRHTVTLGAASDERGLEAPTVGDSVHIAPGVVMIGKITVGDGARIGPNAVVTSDVPAGARVLAPSSEIRERRTGTPERDS